MVQLLYLKSFIDVPKTKRDVEDLKNKLKEALKQAHGKLKSAIQQLLNLSKDRLQDLQRFILNLLKKIGVTSDSRNRREIGKYDLLTSHNKGKDLSVQLNREELENPITVKLVYSRHAT